ncbi:MAG TPA: SMC-Scp complex subunit ScpB [Methylomirabilota bacterium]|nr:SMC-Scp complex subunit ScpB [Methylomirabilota bacterium]
MELKSILEALLFSSQRPLTPKELRDILNKVAAEQTPEGSEVKPTRHKEDEVAETLESLAKELNELGRSFRLICVAGAWQFVSQPEYAPWLKALVGEKNRPSRLSAPALETLAIIAYRQPLTRAEVEQIRGVSVDGVMQTLVERGLVEAVGRAEVVGRPVTYGTTRLFLEYFGLAKLEDLPAADELRKIVVQKPEQLLTADATARPGTEAVPAGATAAEGTGGEESKETPGQGTGPTIEGASGSVPAEGQSSNPAAEGSER